MPLTASNLIWKRAENNSDVIPASNGGRVNLSDAITPNVKNNLFADVGQAERQAGSDKLRKIFLHVDTTATNENIVFTKPAIYINQGTNADDFVVFTPGTKTDTEATRVVEKYYGCGKLAADYTAGDGASITVTCENYAFFKANSIFSDLGTVAITDGTYTQKVVVLAANYNDSTSTVTLTFQASLPYSFSADNTVVSSVYLAPDEVSATSTELVLTKASTTPAIIAASYPTSDGYVENYLEYSNSTIIDQAITLTFVNPSGGDPQATKFFTIRGDSVGMVFKPSGELFLGDTVFGADVTYPNTTKPWFKILPEAFKGTFCTGDTVTFSFTSATLPIWVRRIVPAGTASLANNLFSLTVEGEANG